MSLIFLIGAAISADGPDLAKIDHAVAKCDSHVMTRTFADEPQRRRAFMIAAFNEQEAIVKARETIADERLALADAGAPAGANDAAKPADPPAKVAAASDPSDRGDKSDAKDPPSGSDGKDAAAAQAAAQPPLDPSVLDRQEKVLAVRQQALDDARMLNKLREKALDLMRQQYVLKCSAGRFSAQN